MVGNHTHNGRLLLTTVDVKHGAINVGRTGRAIASRRLEGVVLGPTR